MSQRRHRHLRVARGAPAATAAAARGWVGRLDPARVLAVGPGTDAPRHLGGTYQAVVLDLHQGLDPDRLAQVQGLVVGGGVLVVRLPEEAPAHPALAAWPYGPRDVGTRLWTRVVEALQAAAEVGGPVAPPPPVGGGTPEQAAVVGALADVLSGASDADAVVLSADRGRGKSSALGLAVRRLVDAGMSPADIVITGPHPQAVAEGLRFAGAGLGFRPLLALPPAPRVVIVDEAAQLPIPVLQALVARLPRARFALATTVGGYEGTGRGFALRFTPWLHEIRRVRALALTAPIRWAAGDPVEAVVRRALLLDADPAPAAAVKGAGPGSGPLGEISRERLATDPQLLEDVFGLLFHAHYRTTPGDLHRLLDAPNLAVHGAWHAGRVVAATLVATEGGLPPEVSRAVALEGPRLRGHALPETLLCHAGRPEAGTLHMVRSVRLAVHPAARRRGLASALVHHVHGAYAPDLFGTLFAASEPVIRMRQALGYAVVRLGGARGARTGEPSVAMVCPRSAAAAALVGALREELARELPHQLALLEVEGWPRDAGLAAALAEGLPAPGPWPAADLDRAVEQFAHGPRPYEAVSGALAAWAQRHPEALEGLSAPLAAVVRARLGQVRSWVDVTAEAGLPSVPAAMRALKRAFREARAVATGAREP